MLKPHNTIQIQNDIINKTQILEFLNANPRCHLATTDGDQPRVRGMLMYQADEDGIIFHIGGFKDLYRQLTKNLKKKIKNLIPRRIMSLNHMNNRLVSY